MDDMYTLVDNNGKLLVNKDDKVLVTTYANAERIKLYFAGKGVTLTIKELLEVDDE